MRSLRLFVPLIAAVVLWAPAARSNTAELPRHGVLGAVLVDDTRGVRVDAVLAHSAASAAHLEAGDIVRSIGETSPANAAAAVQAVRRMRAGTQVTFAITRDGAPRSVDVVLGTPAREQDAAVRTLYEQIAVDGSPRRTLVDVPANAAGRRPAVLLIGGIGCFSVDVASNPQDGYLRIARDLARAGFVTMRLEKSGVGDSAGPPCREVDYVHESASYAAAFDALRRDAHVDPARMYVLGHSIGTLIAPRLALERPVAGVIVAEAVGRNWIEYELANLRRQLEIGGEAPAAIDAIMSSKERCMHRLLVAREDEAQIERDEPDCARRNGIYPVAARYMQQVAALNIIEPWTRIAVPVLVLYGTADYVVAADDHVRIARVINTSHPGAAALVPVEAMDHNLQEAATPEAFYGANEHRSATRYQTRFSDDVVGWLCARERCAAQR